MIAPEVAWFTLPFIAWFFVFSLVRLMRRRALSHPAWRWTFVAAIASGILGGVLHYVWFSKM